MKKALTDDFVTDDEMAQLRQAEIDHPATEHTNAGGWCKHCGCGNEVLGHKHLKACNRPAPTDNSLTDPADMEIPDEGEVT